MDRNSSWENTFAIGFIALCLLSAILFGDVKIHLQCEKYSPGEIYCQLTRTRIFGEVEETFKQGELKRAILDKDIVYDDEGVSTTYYNVLLETHNGKIPFGIRTTSIEYQKDRVNQINDFLENTNTTMLDIEEDNLQRLLWSFIIGSISILFIFGLIPITYLCWKLYRGIRVRVVSILNQVNKKPKKAPLFLDKETLG